MDLDTAGCCRLIHGHVIWDHAHRANEIQIQQILMVWCGRLCVLKPVISCCMQKHGRKRARPESMLIVDRKFSILWQAALWWNSPHPSRRPWQRGVFVCMPCSPS